MNMTIVKNYGQREWAGQNQVRRTETPGSRVYIASWFVGSYACSRMRELLFHGCAGYGKQRLSLLGSEIRVTP